MSTITMNETLGNIFDAMNYARQQADNQTADPENREMYLEDAVVLKTVLETIDRHFGTPDPLHHWFYRGDWKN